MDYRTYDNSRRPSTIYEVDEEDSYYRPSLSSSSPRINLSDIPESSYIDYDLGDDEEGSLLEYGDEYRSPSPVYRSNLITPIGNRIETPSEREIGEFANETTNRSHYTWKDPQKTTKSVASPSSSRELPPFYDETTNRTHFTWKDPQSRRKKEDTPDRELAPFFGETTYKSQYIEKIPTRVKAIKQDDHRTNEVPFYSETSHRTHFVPKQGERALPIKRSSTIGFDGDFGGKSTTKDIHGELKNIPKEKSLKRQDTKLFGKDTSYNTTNKRVFTPKESTICPAEYYIAKREKLHHVGKHFYIRHLMKDQRTNDKTEVKLEKKELIK